MKAKLGIAPIAWWNDDLAELSDDVSLEECLRQASVAGFTGMETGRRFPMNMGELGPNLARYGISVCGGWFSGLLLDGDIEREKDRVRAQMDFFIAAKAPCIVYGETARSIQGVRSAPLATKPKLSEDEIKAYGRKMTPFAEWCAGVGMPISYHHHMAAAIETEPELDLLMANSGEALPLLFDAGHMAFAGGDVLRVIDKHHKRISHVHTKTSAAASSTSWIGRGRASWTLSSRGPLQCPATARSTSPPSSDGWPPMAMRAGSWSRPSRIRRSIHRSKWPRKVIWS
ncbi:inosose dehydratase [Rhizobiales bacterium GAS113]|nr:inosose dehydratase [Rhizobiales bacterium GAS113]